MSKQKRPVELNVAEKFFIENHRNLSSGDIAEKLGNKDLAVAIQVYIDSLPPLPVPKPPTAGEMMIHKTTEKQSGGVTIMTPQASQKGDFKSAPPQAKDLSDRIFKINPQK